VVISFYQWLDVQGLLYSELPIVGIGMVLVYALIVAAFVAVVELLTPGAFDNLVIPLGTAVLLYLIWAYPAGVPFPDPFVVVQGILR
jgi:hypothetical protein